MELVKTRFAEGVWEGVLSGPLEPPRLSVAHAGKMLPSPKITKSEGDQNAWAVFVEVPVEVLADGAHTLQIRDAATGDILEVIHILAGDALDEDLRAEIQLLRDELDMLKRAFRRHCVETA